MAVFPSLPTTPPMSAEVPIETRRAILESMIADSKSAEFRITASAKAFTTCGMTPQAEAQVKNLEGQQAMTAALEKQKEELV